MFMVDFAPFSAVLVNCKFYRPNINYCMFFPCDKCAPGASISFDDIDNKSLSYSFSRSKVFGCFPYRYLISKSLPYLMSEFYIPYILPNYPITKREGQHKFDTTKS